MRLRVTLVTETKAAQYESSFEVTPKTHALIHGADVTMLTSRCRRHADVTNRRASRARDPTRMGGALGQGTQPGARPSWTRACVDPLAAPTGAPARGPNSTISCHACHIFAPRPCSAVRAVRDTKPGSKVRLCPCEHAEVPTPQLPRPTAPPARPQRGDFLHCSTGEKALRVPQRCSAGSEGHETGLKNSAWSVRTR